MQNLEVCDFGLVASFGEDLEAVLDELRGGAAEDCLLAEQVGLGLFGEGGLDDACAGCAEALCVRQRQCECFAGCILLNCDQGGNAAACFKFSADGVAGTLGSNHCHVDTLRCGDVAEADIEAVCEEQCVAGLQVGFDAFCVDLCLDLVRGQNHNDVCFCCCFCNGCDSQAFCLSLGTGLGALGQTVCGPGWAQH